MGTRKPWDHGTAQQAIDWAVDHESTEAATFLRCWREGNLTEWPEFYAWLDRTEADERRERALSRKAAKAFRLRPISADPQSGEAVPALSATDAPNSNPHLTTGGE